MKVQIELGDLSRLADDVLERELAERGVSEWEVAVNTAAASFYRRRGFVPSEELLRRPFTERR